MKSAFRYLFLISLTFINLFGAARSLERGNAITASMSEPQTFAFTSTFNLQWDFGSNVSQAAADTIRNEFVRDFAAFNAPRVVCVKNAAGECTVDAQGFPIIVSNQTLLNSTTRQAVFIKAKFEVKEYRKRKKAREAEDAEGTAQDTIIPPSASMAMPVRKPANK